MPQRGFLESGIRWNLGTYLIDCISHKKDWSITSNDNGRDLDSRIEVLSIPDPLFTKLLFREVNRAEENATQGVRLTHTSLWPWESEASSLILSFHICTVGEYAFPYKDAVAVKMRSDRAWLISGLHFIISYYHTSHILKQQNDTQIEQQILSSSVHVLWKNCSHWSDSITTKYV